MAGWVYLGLSLGEMKFSCFIMFRRVTLIVFIILPDKVSIISRTVGHWVRAFMCHWNISFYSPLSTDHQRLWLFVVVYIPY